MMTSGATYSGVPEDEKSSLSFEMMDASPKSAWCSASPHVSVEDSGACGVARDLGRRHYQ